MYAVEVEAERMEPIPDYFGEVQLARWMGVTRDHLRNMPIRDVEEARVTMHALNEAQEMMHQKASKR